MVEIYKHDATRKNNPPVGLAELDRPPPQPRKAHSYDAHLDPQLVWAGKAERTSFEVDTVSLHIHERVSTEAILRAVKREEAQRSLFEQTQLSPSKQIEFYQHDVGWQNRLVLGDSLVVMNSLLEREHMAGQVQCVYMDPPYGVKFNSNFQPTIGRRDVKDGDDASLTREPEQIQAYRDTWELGVHTYLSYLRDRLRLARELLADSGSLFVQISDENVHHVREVLDETFGAGNCVNVICFAKTSGATGRFLGGAVDYLLWYGKDRSQTKFRPLFVEKDPLDWPGMGYSRVREARGHGRMMTEAERRNPRIIDAESRVYTLGDLTSQSIGREKGAGAACWFPVMLDGVKYLPAAQVRWKTNEEGIARLLASGRLEPAGNTLRYVRYVDDFPVAPMSNLWADTGVAGYASEKRYVVETSPKVIQRCILMASDPGDLVLDPTCGSGTTAFVAEQWGRRWITCDTSRVALALARQRLLTTKYPYYRLRTERVRDGFVYRTVPHITLRSIAQNPRLDECKTQADRERTIRETAEQEVLYDQPEQSNDRIRISGPFTVEAIPVAALADASDEDQDGANEGNTFADAEFVRWLIDKLRVTGVVFPDGKDLKVPSLRPVIGPYEWFHGEGEIGQNGGTKRIAVSFGPRHAPVTPGQVFKGIEETRGYDVLLFIGFSCDPEAGRIISQGMHGRQMFYANAAPDILVGDLLKTKKTTRLFSVFGQPDVTAHPEDGGGISMELAGVDLYDPSTGETTHDLGENVAAWFVDHDYDSRTFCICQALFPAKGMKNPWEKLQRALKGTIDEDKFEQLRTTRSLPFKPGKKVAIKVIDQRGNEVIQVVSIDAKTTKRGGRKSS